MDSHNVAELLGELTQSQRERLAYIEVRSNFCGELTRADIERRFGVKPAASSRDLATYRRLAPDNLTYQKSLRRHVPSERFKPIFPSSAERVLSWLRCGMGDGLDPGIKLPVPCEGASPLVNPDLGVLATLTRSIAAKRLCQVEYISLNSGLSSRVVAPIALADTGQRWHLRAYDQKNKRFSDFVLTRISKAEALAQPSAEHERLDADTQWARVVRLELGPHPGAKHPEAIEADYGMRSGMLVLDLRAPLVGYALRRWAVDCSRNAELDPQAHHLRLLNHATLYGVDSAALAPGYAPGEGGAFGAV
jgi:hypothetical protein